MRHTDPLHPLCQKLIGNAWIRILFLDQAGNTQTTGLVKQRTAGITTNPDGSLRFKIFQDCGSLP